MDKEECIQHGGIGKFAIEICGICGQLENCEIAAKTGYPEFLKKKKESLQLDGVIRGRKVGKRYACKNDLCCIYCGNSPKKCLCKNKPIARFEVKEKKKKGYL